MARIMALDLGDRRIGIALSDIMKIIAGGYETYNRSGDENRDLEYIAKLSMDNDVDDIVIGLPINMDGTEGERVTKSKDFADKLRPLVQAKINFQDERLTTVSAERMLIDADMRRNKRKQVIDKIAATIILQTYMEKISRL